MDMTKTITLQNKWLTAIFSRETGALQSLEHRGAGWRLLGRPELGLSFRMQVPLPDRHWNLIEGGRQAVSACRVAPDGSGVTFVWEHLASEYGGEHAIGFTADVSLGEDGLAFRGEVRNASDLTVEVVAYPCFGDITPSTPEGKLEGLAASWGQSMRRIPLAPNFNQGTGYWGVQHLVQNQWENTHEPFIMLAEADRGFYLGAHQAEPARMVRWFFERKPGFLDSYLGSVPAGEIGGQTAALELMAQHFLFVQPGETAKLLPIVLQPYTGTWHRGADLYRNWRKTWYQRPATPAWLDDIHAWLQIQINGAEDNLNFRYTDLPDVAADCKRHGIGAIQLTGWAFGGQDRGNPRHDTDDRLGTREELARAIEACHKMGVKIVLFSKFTWYDQSQPFYAGEGLAHVARDPYGNPYPAGGYQYHTWTQLAGINTRWLIPTCTASPAWRRQALEEFKKVVDLGAAGMLFDECQHHGRACYCFSKEHAHPFPAYLHGYDNILAREFKSYSAGVAPDFLYAGEDCTDFEMREYHLAYTRFGRDHVPTKRYIDPRLPIMMAVTGFDDRNQLNKCLQYRYIISYEPFNFKGRPSDAPLTLAYGQKVDDLRRRYRQYLWDGDFRHVLGATVTAKNAAHEDYAVFSRADGKRALVIANTDPQESLEASFALEGGASGPFVAVDPEQPEPRPVATKVEVPPRSVVVLLEC